MFSQVSKNHKVTMMTSNPQIPYVNNKHYVVTICPIPTHLYYDWNANKASAHNLISTYALSM